MNLTYLFVLLVFTSPIVLSAQLNHPSGARIEQQMREFDTTLSFEYEDMLSRFKAMRQTLDSDLPHSEVDSAGVSLSNEEERPTSKCRERLAEAKKFSETNYLS